MTGVIIWLGEGVGPYWPTIHIQHDSLLGWSIWSDNGRQMKRWEWLALAGLLFVALMP